MTEDLIKKLAPTAGALYKMFLQEYIHFGYIYGGALSESFISKSFLLDGVNDLLAQNLIQKQEQDEIICYELSLFEKRKLLEENLLVEKWSTALGTTLLCDKELSRVYGKGNPQIDYLIEKARFKKMNKTSVLREHDFLL